MTVSVVSTYRLVVPVPAGGWLSGLWPVEAAERVGRAHELRTLARSSVAAARLPDGLGVVHAVVTFRPQRIAPVGQVGLHVAEDLRPSWHPVRDELSRVGVRCRTEELRLGPPTGELEPLMVVDLEVRRG